MGLTEINNLAFKYNIPFNDVTDAIKSVGEEYTSQLLSNLNHKIKPNVTPVTVFRNEIRNKHISESQTNKLQGYIKEMKDYDNGIPKLDTPDIRDITIVEIERGYAMSGNEEVYANQWRWLLHIYPEAESKCPQRIMESVNQWRDVHEKGLMIGDKIKEDLPF